TVSQAHRQAESALKSLESQGFFASIPEQDAPLIVFGGPDGVLIPYERFRRTTLKDSILRNPLIKLLRQGQRVVVISNLRYYDYIVKGQDGAASVEMGIESRLMEYIPRKLRQYLTVYTSAGTFKVEFDSEGRALTDNDFNNQNYIPRQDVDRIIPLLEQAIEEYWQDYTGNPSFWRNKYPNFNFRKPEVILHQDRQNRVFGISVLYLPSERLESYHLEPGEESARSNFLNRVTTLVEQSHALFWSEYTIREAGATSIDIRKRHTGKDHALRHHLLSEDIRPQDVVLFANLAHYSEDQPFANVKGVSRFVNEADASSVRHFKQIGRGLSGIYHILEGLARGEPLSNLLKADNPPLAAALSYLKAQKQQEFYNSLTEKEKIELLYSIYQDFSLTYVDYPCWTELFIEAMDINRDTPLGRALVQVIEQYAQAQVVDEYFRAIDNIFSANPRLDFFSFYSAVDLRVARNLSFFNQIYIDRLNKSGQGLLRDVYAVSQQTGLTISRVLAGYFQDSFYLRYKKSLIREKPSRAPPRIVYLGGGGKATTTLLQTFIAKGLDKLACIISSSDDGGSSWKIMETFFNKLGIYFIPPGDAAGLAIFLSNDNFKIFTLFWAESEKGIPGYITSKGRIRAAKLSPVWERRIEEVLGVLEDPGKLQEIQAVLPDKAEVEKSKDAIVFFSSLLSLGELLDRELIEKGILNLEKDKQSSANLMLIGAAYDLGVIGQEKGINPAELSNIEKLLSLSNDTQFVPVSWNYERCSLVARYENGEVVRSQTLITDKGHTEFIESESFHHRVGTDTTEKDFILIPLGDANYPRPLPQALKPLNEGEIILMGNGSLWTSLIPVLLYPEVAEAVLASKAAGIPVVYIAKIKADLETSRNVRVVDEKGNPVAAAEEIAEGRQYYLKIEERDQRSLGSQLEIIRQHISRVLGKEVSLNEIFSHIIVPQLSESTVAELHNVPLSITEAKELVEALAQGKAQVSKYVKGVQPLFINDERARIEAQGIKVVDVPEQHITGIDEKSPNYENEYLAEIVEGILSKPKEQGTSEEEDSAPAYRKELTPKQKEAHRRLSESNRPESIGAVSISQLPSYPAALATIKALGSITIEGYGRLE
ncbi:MAG: hypothetical protein DRH17_13800, partial [Deltaproteobacteria bacterium]